MNCPNPVGHQQIHWVGFRCFNNKLYFTPNVIPQLVLFYSICFMYPKYIWQIPTFYTGQKTLRFDCCCCFRPTSVLWQKWIVPMMKKIPRWGCRFIGEWTFGVGSGVYTPWSFLVPIKGGRYHIAFCGVIYVICYLPPFMGTRNNHIDMLGCPWKWSELPSKLAYNAYL